MQQIIDLLEYMGKTTTTVYEAIARLENAVRDARVHSIQAQTEKQRRAYDQQERALQAALDMSKKVIHVSSETFRAVMAEYGFVESPAPIERTASGLIFEAVYGGAHDAQTCVVEGCPCKEVAQPFANARLEGLAVIVQIEHNVTIEQARAALKDW